MKHSSHMTKEIQRQSIHWFFNLAVQRGVISSLPNDKPLAEMWSVPNHIFLPSSNDCKYLDASFLFHIAKVLVTHTKCLKRFKKRVPNFIYHRYVKELSQKSQFCVLDLLNKSENKWRRWYQFCSISTKTTFRTLMTTHPLLFGK